MSSGRKTTCSKRFALGKYMSLQRKKRDTHKNIVEAETELKAGQQRLDTKQKTIRRTVAKVSYLFFVLVLVNSSLI